MCKAHSSGASTWLPCFCAGLVFLVLLRHEPGKKFLLARPVVGCALRWCHWRRMNWHCGSFWHGICYHAPVVLHICIDQLGDSHGTDRRRRLEDGEGQ